jgi:hypothetical protein
VNGALVIKNDSSGAPNMATDHWDWHSNSDLMLYPVVRVLNNIETSNNIFY